jgi:acetylornithine deacetylase
MNFKFDRDEYVSLLAKMISCTQRLQNKPPQFIPMESLIADIVKTELNGLEFIKIEEKCYKPNRSNLIIKYENYKNSVNNKSLGFIGSHMDVVPANPEEWHRDPFELIVDENDEDILWGRGTTDCLNHVALLTVQLKHLSKNNVKLDYTLGVVFIADEESGEDKTIGISQLAKDGYLDFLKNGPVYWVDSSDTYPTVGSGTGMAWELTVYGKRGHSGMPFNCINPVPIAFEASKSIIKKFSQLFPQHPNDIIYKYPCSSNMKQTQIIATEGSINQIPNCVTIKGDVRLTPFWDWRIVRQTILDHVQEINDNMQLMLDLDPTLPIILPDGSKARVEFKWLGDPYVGIACDMKSIGFSLISNATQKVMGQMKFVSCCGSLPLIAELQEMGFDMQIIGYGNGDAYHANNEYCRVSGMTNGYNIILDVIMNYN